MHERSGALMAASGYDQLARHVGHFIECTTYANGTVALECVMCAEVLYGLSKEAELAPEALSAR